MMLLLLVIMCGLSIVNGQVPVARYSNVIIIIIAIVIKLLIASTLQLY